MHDQARLVVKIDSKPGVVLTSPFGRAGTVETVLVADAGAAVGAGIAGAVIDGAVGRVAHVSRIADALGSVGVLDADAVGRASRVLAQDVQFTMAAHEARRTLAVISADVVDTLAPVLARPGQALVQVLLAVLSLEARRTVADVSAVVIEAHAVVQTRVRQALVDVHVAVGAFVAENRKTVRETKVIRLEETLAHQTRIAHGVNGLLYRPQPHPTSR